MLFREVVGYAPVVLTRLAEEDGRLVETPDLPERMQCWLEVALRACSRGDPRGIRPEGREGMKWFFVVCVLFMATAFVNGNHVLLSRLAGRCRFEYPQAWDAAPCRCQVMRYGALECRGGTLWVAGDRYEPWGAMLPDGRRVCTAGPFVVRRGKGEWILADSLEVWVFPAPKSGRRIRWLAAFLDVLTGTSKTACRSEGGMHGGEAPAV